MIYFRKEKFKVLRNNALYLEDACECGRNFKYSVRDGQVVLLGQGKNSVRYVNSGERSVQRLSESRREHMNCLLLPVTESRLNT